MQRRRFLASAIAVPVFAGTLHAREPIVRRGDPRFRYALAAYSLREYFSVMRGRAQKPKPDGNAIDLFGFIDYCASIGAQAAELTAYFLPKDFDKGYLLELKQHAFLSGIAISGTAIGNDFTVGSPEALQKQIEETVGWIRTAADLGAPHVRIFAGTAAQLGDSAEKLSTVCDAVAQVAKFAADHGVFLGIENHGGISASQLLQIMKRVDSEWVGINLDTGNFVSDDPYRDMEQCAPYAVNVQVKTGFKRLGKEHESADFSRIAAILRAANYQGFVVLEYEDSKPYERIPTLFKDMTKAFV